MGAMGAFAAVSSISSVGNAYSQSRAINAQGAYESAISDTNTKIAGLNAKQTIEAGDLAAARKEAQTGQVVGSMKAAQGASGTDVASGSNVLTRIGTEFAGRIDAMTIRNNAARAAWGYKTEAIQDSYQGQFERLAATSKSQQTLLTGGIQAIEGPLGIYANYSRWSRYMGGGADEGVPFNASTASGTSAPAPAYEGVP